MLSWRRFWFVAAACAVVVLVPLPGQTQEFSAAAGNDGRAEARRRPVRSGAGGAGRRRSFGAAGRLGRRSRSPGETDDAQACRS